MYVFVYLSFSHFPFWSSLVLLVLFSQSTNQWINESLNQSTSQWINESIYLNYIISIYLSLYLCIFRSLRGDRDQTSQVRMALAQAQAVASSSFQAPDAGIICTFPPCLLLVSQLGTLEPPPLRPNAPLMGIYIYIHSIYPNWDIGGGDYCNCPKTSVSHHNLTSILLLSISFPIFP